MSITGVAFSPANGNLVATCGDDGATRIWDMENRVQVWEQKVEGSKPWQVAFSPDGKLLATSYNRGSVRLLDLASKEQRKIQANRKSVANDLAFHPSGELLGIAYNDGRVDLVQPTGKLTRSLRGHGGSVESLAFSPDGKLLASAGIDGTVRTWEVATGRPAWRSPLLSPSPPTLISHLGLHRLDSQGKASPEQPSAGWQRQVLERARLASLSPDGKTVCMVSHQGVLRRLNRADSSLMLEARPGEVGQVLALDRGCVVLGTRETSMITGPDRSVRLHGPASAVARGGKGSLLLLAGQQVVEVGLDGKQRATRKVGTGASALALVGGRVVVGYASGDMGIGPASGGAIKGLALDHTPASPVVAMAAGPRGTIIVGFANGQFGLWHLKDGKRLDHGRLHGPVIHLLVKDQKLYAASELGDHMVRDLSPLYKERCALMNDVWERVPVVWSGGAAVNAAPKKDHPCNR